jgi:hypothetical protein
MLGGNSNQVPAFISTYTIACMIKYLIQENQSSVGRTCWKINPVLFFVINQEIKEFDRNCVVESYNYFIIFLFARHEFLQLNFYMFL